MLAYYSVEQMIQMLDESVRTQCERIMEDHGALFETAQGSSHNHQAWLGGYADHVRETMNIAIMLYRSLSTARPLPFTVSDALLVMFLHDIEKPWKYELGDDGELHEIEALRDKGAQHEYRAQKLAEYGITLTLAQENAMEFVEGEYRTYSNKRRVSGPLAAFCHLCDVTSARIWFDCPRAWADPWTYARRSITPEG